MPSADVATAKEHLDLEGCPATHTQHEREENVSSSYAVKRFKVKKAKNVEEELGAFLNDLASKSWKVVSVMPGLDIKGAGLVGNRPDSFLVVVAR